MTTRPIINRRPDPDIEQSLPADMHPVLRRVYAARGVTPATLDTSLAAMRPISLLDGTPEAAERLAAARRDQESVLVVGDFDTDGATATALMMRCLRGFGFTQVDYLVPDREKFGYGLSVGLVEAALQRRPQLIITVDNGISSVDGVDAASAGGVDVIVTDHHLPGDELPRAQVIVNPNAGDNRFPSKCLAGVGVAFYVMAALGQRLAADGLMDAAAARVVCAACLDLVALGTVADLVPLDANNRILVAQGLARIRSGHSRPGIEALFRVAGRNVRDAVAADMGFSIAPRLNAAGRLDDMSVGIECLLADSVAAATNKAEQLNNLNLERRTLQARMQAEAETHLAQAREQQGKADKHAYCLYHPDWHPGVVGLVATRIKDLANRPVVAFAGGAEDGTLKGSGRSVAGVHIRDVLAAVDARHPGVITRFGGHAMAAGLSIAPDKLKAFERAFAAEAGRFADQIDDSGRLYSDGQVPPEDLSLPMAELLRQSGPWGQGFPEPAFDGEFKVLQQRIVGERHLKLDLLPRGGDGPIGAIAFNHPELLPVDESRECVAVFRLDVNEFRGLRQAQLVVEHIECV